MNKQHGNINKSKCIACGGTGAVLHPHMQDHLFGVKGKWALIKCKNCGLVWLDPKPMPHEIHRFYDTYHTHGKSEYISSFMVKISMTILFSSALKPIQRFRKFSYSMIPPFREVGNRSLMWLPAKPGGKLLDVGCGNGIFLKRMHKFGWDVSGVEPDSKAAQQAMINLKSDKIVIGNIENSGFEDNTFDAITMNHVVEHLLDPVDTLKNCFRILKPNGLLVVATPNAESLGARHFKNLWRGWEPPRHIHIFSPRSLKLVAEQAGFHIVSNTTPSGMSYSIWVLSMLLQEKIFLKKKDMPAPNNKVKFKSAIMWGVEDALWRLGIQRGEELALLAQKPQ